MSRIGGPLRAARRELVSGEGDQQRNDRAVREGRRVEDRCKGLSLRVRVVPRFPGRSIRDGDRDLEVRQSGREEPLVPVGRAAVEHLDDELDVARVEEPEVAGLIRQADGVSGAGEPIRCASRSPRSEIARRPDRAPIRTCSRRWWSVVACAAALLAASATTRPMTRRPERSRVRMDVALQERDRRVISEENLDRVRGDPIRENRGVDLPEVGRELQVPVGIEVRQ